MFKTLGGKSTGEEPAMRFGSMRFKLCDIMPPPPPVARRQAIISLCEGRLISLQAKPKLTEGERVELDLLLGLKYCVKKEP